MNSYFNIYKTANNKKEPWQMTKYEFFRQEKSLRNLVTDYDKFLKEHEENIKNADFKPLYKFLQKAGNYDLSWADGFMFMGRWKYLLVSSKDNGKITWALWREIGNEGKPIEVNAESIVVYQYKHGISRKSVTVSEDGELFGYVKDPKGLAIWVDKKILTHVNFVDFSSEEVLQHNRIVSKNVLQDRDIEATINAIYQDIDSGSLGKVNRNTKYNEYYKAQRDKELIDAGYKILGPGPAGVEIKNEATTHHREVEKALQKGLPVPADVLLDYPDLQKKYRNQI